MNGTIGYLTDDFYETYSSQYLEMEKKPDRPYLHLVLSYKNKKVVIPFRSYIRHNYAFPTSDMDNSGTFNGLDFSKALIVEEKYLSTKPATINGKEHNIVKQNLYAIEIAFKKYVDLYKKNYIKINKGITHKAIIGMCNFSCLQYFHDEIGL